MFFLGIILVVLFVFISTTVGFQRLPTNLSLSPRRHLNELFLWPFDRDSKLILEQLKIMQSSIASVNSTLVGELRTTKKTFNHRLSDLSSDLGRTVESTARSTLQLKYGLPYAQAYSIYDVGSLIGLLKPDYDNIDSLNVARFMVVRSIIFISGRLVVATST